MRSMAFAVKSRLKAMAAAGIVGLALLAGGRVLAAEAPAAAPAADTVYDAAQVRGDFDELYTLMQASHYDLYARRPKAEYDARFRKMRAAIKEPMKRVEMQARFQDFLAYGNVAHARIDFIHDPYHAYLDGGGKAFPLDVRVVKGAALVAENRSGLDSIAVGDEILAVDGEPAAAWVKRLRGHLSADTDYMAHAMLEWSLPSLVWLQQGSLTQFRLKLRDAHGAVHEVVLPARGKAEMDAAAKAQPKLFELDWDAREQRMLDQNVAYLRPGPFYNNDPAATDMWDVAAFSAFIDGAFQHFIDSGAKSLIIDLRDNAGGDNSFSDRMVAWFADQPFRFASDFRIKASQAAIDSNRQRIDAGTTDTTSPKLAAAYASHKVGEVFSFDYPPGQPRQGQRFQGKVYLLINRHSYSNTVTVAALAQDYHFATLLGEETSDLATSYGAMEHFSLSRSGIAVGFPKAYLIRPNGSTVARGARPDIAIETPAVPGAEDEVLQQALKIVEDRAAAGSS